MNIISATEWELLSFFEAEPEFRDPDAPWPYTDALYRVQQGNLSLSAAIAPAYRDVRLILSIDSNRLFEFSAIGVQDVRYVKEYDMETLEIVIDDRNSMTLRIHPRIEIDQRAERE